MNTIKKMKGSLIKSKCFAKICELDLFLVLVFYVCSVSNNGNPNERITWAGYKQQRHLSPITITIIPIIQSYSDSVPICIVLNPFCNFWKKINYFFPLKISCNFIRTTNLPTSYGKSTAAIPAQTHTHTPTLQLVAGMTLETLFGFQS